MSVPGSLLKSEYPREQMFSQVYSHSQHGVSSSPGSFIDNLFIPSIHEKNMEEEEDEDYLSSQWLSNFVEDCLFSSGNCIPPTTTTLFKQPSTNLKTTHQNHHQNPPSSLVEKPVWKSKRTKRKRPTTNPLTTWSSSHPHYFEHPQNNQNLLRVNNTSTTTYSDPPLLHQAYWLADSELILPQKMNKTSHNDEEMFKKTDYHDDVEEKMGFDPKDSLGSLKGSSTSTLGQQPRRCTHCLAQRTPQWRAGPLGPKTLCNACGLRFKSGRLLPEYRPAKQTTQTMKSNNPKE